MTKRGRCLAEARCGFIYRQKELLPQWLASGIARQFVGDIENSGQARADVMAVIGNAAFGCLYPVQPGGGLIGVA